MTIPSPSRCRGSSLTARLSLALATGTSPCAFGAIVPDDAANALSVVTDLAPSAASADTQELYLEVNINGARTGKLARFVLRGGQLLGSPQTLRQLGLRLPPEAPENGLLPLKSLTGAEVTYDAARQTLELQVPTDLLDRPVYRANLAQPPPTLHERPPQAPGLLLNYDVYGQRSGDYASLNGFSELRLFGLGPGLWSNTMTSGFSQVDGTARAINNTRLDSRWQLDLPDTMLSITVGDTLTGALDWTRATRIGGIRISRNFALQPYRTTAPLASFAGEATLPSTVDLYIEGIRQARQQIQPGRFQLDSAPLLNGAGQAQMVITDINGQSRTVGFSLYGTPDLLQAGLSDWSLDLGVLRQDYGQRSFAYGGVPIASFSLRRGINDHLTLEAHAETTDGMGMAGVGGVVLLGQRGGVLSGSLGRSQSGNLGGREYSLGYQWSSPVFSFSASTLAHSPGFRDVAAVREQAPLPARTTQAFAGISTPLGQFGASYIAQRYPTTSANRYVGINWSRSFRHNTLLSLNLNRDLDDHTNTAFAYWSVPLDRRTTLAASLRHANDGNSLSLDANRSVSGDTGGWGWRTQARLGDTRGGQIEVTQLGQYGQWTASLDRQRGTGSDTTLLQASASGAIAWFAGQLRPMRRVDDAFALVSTNGIADVPVRLENRPVGNTNAGGWLLINQLAAWQHNQLSIDPQDLPVDMLLGTTVQDVAPASRSGALVHFDLRRSLSLEFGVRDRNGDWIPAGTLATLEAPGAPPQRHVIGHEGRIYLQDPPAGAQLRIHGDSAACIAPVPASPLTEGRIHPGDVTCR